MIDINNSADFEEKFGLTPEQEKAVKSLERAFKRCYKEGILFFNNYGSLIAYNKEYVKCVDDKPEAPLIDGDIGRKVNSVVNLESWADDQHFVHLHDHVKSELSGQKHGDEDESPDAGPPHDLAVHSWEIEELAQRCGHLSPDLQLVTMCVFLLMAGVAVSVEWGPVF